ncbi:MAG: diaminopimelate decarboxylase [Deltaproteobacteria bacterium]|nr:diaminopimelate decarboxylase [Deltaproteobacteria bacterium]
MSAFSRRGGELCCEAIAVSELAKKFGTPLYVYSKNGIVDRCRGFRAALGNTKICYAVKANSNPSILTLLHAAGFGMDVVSVGEMEHALKAGALPSDIVFSGVGKTDAEIERGISLGIFSFNVESRFEMEAIARIVARLKKPVRISFRVNPNVDVMTIPYIATGLYENKFGVPEGDLAELLEIVEGEPLVKLVGIGCHLGSQLLELKPYQLASSRLAKIASELKVAGHPIEFIDMGGGLGVSYVDEKPPSLKDYGAIVRAEADRLGVRLVIEPGRSVIADNGILVASVLGCKSTPKRNFCVVDAAMNDLIRPSLYEAVHRVEPVVESPVKAKFDVVGPICETGDFLGRDIPLPQLSRGDLIAVLTTGAYGMSMASNYNARPRPAEVWVDGSDSVLIRPRERPEQGF